MRRPIPERYTLIRTLQEGAHSTTFLVNDQLMEQDNLVLKLIRNEEAHFDRDQIIRFFSWQVGFRHRNFARVWDAGLATPHHLYYVREYFPHSEFFATDRSWATKCLTSTIAFLLKHGYVHGGIKPSNLFFTKENLILTDAKYLGVKPDNERESRSLHCTGDLARGRC